MKKNAKCVVSYPPQQWLCKSATMLRYVYIAYLFQEYLGV